MDLEGLLSASEKKKAKREKSSIRRVEAPGPGPRPIDEQVLPGMFELCSTAKDSEEIRDHFQLVPNPVGTGIAWVPKTPRGAVDLTLRQCRVSNGINLFIPQEILQAISNQLSDEDIYLIKLVNERRRLEEVRKKPKVTPKREPEYNREIERWKMGFDCCGEGASYESFIEDRG